MLKKIFIIVLLVAVVGAVLGALFFWNQVSWPVNDDTTTTLFSVSEGEGVNEISRALSDQGLIRNMFWFETYVWLNRSESGMIAGNYTLSPSMSTREIVRALTSGVASSERTITTIEGWTIADIASYLSEEGVVSADSFIEAATVVDSRTINPNTVYAFLADKPADQGLEGFLFPDTYRIFNTGTSEQIIQKMLDNFDKKFTEDMYAAARDRGMSVYDIVTLASIIEKEAKIVRAQGAVGTNDHYIVAGVFYNRLNNGIPLQSDATVNFATGGNNPQPTSRDLEIDSRYNTYKYAGLPPGPINSPSLEAIKAALYPEDTDYFYFLHRINDDDSIVFSKTYSEHLENKARYLQ